jgi:AAA family ATP:ADP antiporter
MKREHLFLLFAMLCSFLIQGEYAIIRPVSSALFLTSFGSASLPYAWLSTLPLNFLLVSLYNKYLPRLGCLKLFLCLSGAVLTINSLAYLFLPHFPWLAFPFYLWKDLYIMLMLQQLWSVIHLNLSFQRAKFLYGFLFATGAAGAMLGSLVPGFCALSFGSESLLLATLPLYLSLMVCYKQLLKYAEKGFGMAEEKARGTLDAFVHGIKLISSSSYLSLILALVVLMQVSVTLIDFQFNTFLEKAVIGTDLRTEAMGKILGVVHLITLCVQLGGSFLSVHYFGLKRSHLVVPLLLCTNALAFQCFPLLGVISCAYVTAKSCDFSLFVILKELLYIPLTPDEKFRAKAVIDVFAHRSAKAIASSLILGLQAILGATFFPFLGWGLIALTLIWGILIVLFLKEPHTLNFNPLTKKGTST